MLTAIKERATGWIAWAIVILITIPFALWGINTYFEGAEHATVAEFDGEEIDYLTYQRALYNERERLRDTYSQNPEFLSGGVLGRLVIDAIVDETLLVRDAQKHGYRVSDQQLVDTIQNHPTFQTENRFDRERYERVLSVSGLSVAEFEELQRQEAVMQQIRTGFQESAFVIDADVDAVLRILLQDRFGQFALINPAAFIADIEVTDAEIQDAYELNKSRYVDDEKVKIEYVRLSVDDFASNFAPSEETLLNLYDAEIARYGIAEQRNISHILLEPGTEASSDVTVLATELIGRIRSGEDFAALAMQYSTDVGSAESGGELGWFSSGELPFAEFESVAFSLGEGEVSEPVESEFGTHIVRVNEIQGETVKSFDEVRSELVEQASRTQAEAEMFEISEQLRNLAYEDPENLNSAATQLDLDIQISDWFTRGFGTGISEHEQVRAAAFSDEVLGQGFNSDLIEVDKGLQVVLRISDHEETQQLSVADVRNQISNELLQSKSQARARELSENLVAELETGADWNSILTANGLEAFELPTRMSETTDPVAIGVGLLAFSSKKPQAGSETFGSGPVADGSHALFRISEVQSGDVASASEEQRQSVAAALRDRFGNEVFASYIQLLRDGVDVSVNQELL
ncbi:MAG: SurA N-terminal domain-containing protein [Acidiferrobacterales bacterium]|nr:SurA N-terminal domain-containing protein [Acidiferrobacterales bacterium]